MKIEYDCSFDIWKESQPGGRLNVKPTETEGIWEVTERVSGDFGYVFVDETENFYPKIYRTVIEAIKGRSDYNLRELG